MALAATGYDPRLHHSEEEEQEGNIPQDNLLPNGTTPNIETYMYYAKIQRAREALSAKSDAEGGRWGSVISRTFKYSPGSDRNSVAPASTGEKQEAASEEGSSVLVTAGEYRAASGALRTATWGSVFYLITTGTLFKSLIFLMNSHCSIRHFGSIFYAVGIPASWIWSRCCLFLRIWCYGCIQWLHLVVAVHETRLGKVPHQVFW